MSVAVIPLDANPVSGLSPHHSELSVATRQLAFIYVGSLEQHKYEPPFVDE